MGKRDACRQDLCIVIQQINVQGAWCIGCGTQPPEVSFHPMQKRQEFNRLERGLHGRYRIYESRLSRVGPSWRLIEGRNGQDFNASLFQPGQGGAQSIRWRANGTWQVGA